MLFWGLIARVKVTFFYVFFPLLKQTINRKIRGVLFWSGYDQNDVDFGDFDTAVNNQKGHDKWNFHFHLTFLGTK